MVYQVETSDEEVRIEEKVNDAAPNLNSIGIWGSTLHHIDDLPYDPHDYFPQAYGVMIQKQDNVRVRSLIPTPKAGSLPFIQLNGTG